MQLTMAKKPTAGSEGKKKPNRRGKAVNVWIAEDLYVSLEKFFDAQRIRPRLTDTIELALQEFLIREGFWPAK